jgi:hypothetical protein
MPVESAAFCIGSLCIIWPPTLSADVLFCHEIEVKMMESEQGMLGRSQWLDQYFDDGSRVGWLH